MKAFSVCSDYSEGSEVIFAENRNQARSIARYHDSFEDIDYKDIRAYRLPLLDGMENSELKDNYWLSEEIRTILVRDYGWRCNEPNEYEPCGECCAKEFCGYYNDILKEKLESEKP